MLVSFLERINRKESLLGHFMELCNNSNISVNKGKVAEVIPLLVRVPKPTNKKVHATTAEVAFLTSQIESETILLSTEAMGKP